MRRRDVVGWIVAFAASCVVGVGSAHAHWTVAKLVRHADGSAAACQVAPHWGPKQIRCANRIVFRREPRLGVEAWLIAGCESGYDESMVDPTGPFLGLGNFLGSTWDALPSWLARHSVFSPPWHWRAMRFLRLQDGDWHQWPACSRRLR